MWQREPTLRDVVDALKVVLENQAKLAETLDELVNIERKNREPSPKKTYIQGQPYGWPK